MADETARALQLAQRLAEQIQRRRYSSGTDTRQPQGIHGALDYYRGRHPLRFASDAFRSHFESQFAGFTDNWCAPVIDATVERMNMLGIRLGDDTRDADAEFQRVMEVNDAGRGTSEMFTVGLASSRAYGLVWGNADDESTPRVTFEHPEFCTLAVDPDTHETTAAAKMWEDNSTGYLTLYTATAVWKWQWTIATDMTNDPRRDVFWEPRQGRDDTWPIPNPLGRVPMFEFKNQSLLDDRPLSDLAGVAAMQDAINLVWAYLFNALDFASLPQRVILGIDIPQQPVLDSNGQIVGTRPIDLKKFMQDRTLWLSNPNAKIDSWPAAQLDVFTAVVESAVDHIASQTRTPPHYLMGKMSNTAAESLTVAETGLVAKVIQRQEYAKRPLREMHALVALAQGDTARADAARTGVIVWSDPQYRSLAQKVDAFVKLRQSGLPLEWCLEWYGLPPLEVKRVMSMTATEAERILGGDIASVLSGPKPVQPDETPATPTIT